MSIWAAIMLIALFATTTVHWMDLVPFVPERVMNLLMASGGLYVIGIGLAMLRLIAGVQNSTLRSSIPDIDSTGVFTQSGTTTPSTLWWDALPEIVFNAPFYLSAALYVVMLIVGARWWIKRKEPLKVSRERARTLSRW